MMSLNLNHIERFPRENNKSHMELQNKFIISDTT